MHVIPVITIATVLLHIMFVPYRRLGNAKKEGPNQCRGYDGIRW